MPLLPPCPAVVIHHHPKFSLDHQRKYFMHGASEGRNCRRKSWLQLRRRAPLPLPSKSPRFLGPGVSTHFTHSTVSGLDSAMSHGDTNGWPTYNATFSFSHTLDLGIVSSKTKEIETFLKKGEKKVEGKLEEVDENTKRDNLPPLAVSAITTLPASSVSKEANISRLPTGPIDSELGTSLTGTTRSKKKESRLKSQESKEVSRKKPSPRVQSANITIHSDYLKHLLCDSVEKEKGKERSRELRHQTAAAPEGQGLGELEAASGGGGAGGKRPSAFGKSLFGATAAASTTTGTPAEDVQSKKAAIKAEVVELVHGLMVKEMQAYADNQPSYIQMVFNSPITGPGKDEKSLEASRVWSKKEDFSGRSPSGGSARSGAGSLMSVHDMFKSTDSFSSATGQKGPHRGGSAQVKAGAGGAGGPVKRIGGNAISKKAGSRLGSRVGSARKRASDAEWILKSFSYAARVRHWRVQLTRYLKEEQEMKMAVDKSKTVSAGCIMEDSSLVAMPYPYPRKFQFEGRDQFTKSMMNEIVVKREPIVKLSTRKFLRSSTCVRPIHNLIPKGREDIDEEGSKLVAPVMIPTATRKDQPANLKSTKSEDASGNVGAGDIVPICSIAKPLVSKTTGAIEIPSNCPPLLYADNQHLNRDWTLHTYEKSHSTKTSLLTSIPNSIHDRIHGNEDKFNRDLFVLQSGGTLPDIDLRLHICRLNEETRKIQSQLDQIFVRQSRKEERQRNLKANHEKAKFLQLKSTLANLADQRYKEKWAARVKEFDDKIKKERASKTTALPPIRYPHGSGTSNTLPNLAPTSFSNIATAPSGSKPNPGKDKDHVRKSVVPSHVVTKKSKQIVLLQ